MALSTIPFALQNGSHSADLFRQAVSSLVPPGGGLVTSGDLAVTQTGAASMNILVGVGRAWVPGTNVGNVTGGNFSKQAMYFALNDAAATVTVGTSDPTNPRIDVVYLAIQDSQYAGTTNTAVLGIAQGVPTSGATYPANATAIPSNAIALAWINVTAGAASIVNANITNLAAQIIKTKILPGGGAQVGTAPGLNDFANNVKSPIIIANTAVVTTDASGYFSINYPQAFPNGVINVMFSNGDSAQGRDLIISTAGSPFTQTTGTCFGSVVDHTGAVKASATIRVNYVAYGF